MTRRRRLDTAPAAAETNPATPPAGRATMRVSLEGDPDQVRSKMNLNQKETAPQTATSEENDKKFFAALENPEYRFRVRRTRPTQWKGRDSRHVVYEEGCPMTYQDIVDEVGKMHGGQHYLLTVFDPANGKTVAGKTFRVDSDPIMKEEEQPESSLEDMLKAEQEPDADEMLDNTMKRQVTQIERQLQLERTQDMLDTLKRKRTTGQNVDNGQMLALEKQLTDLRHQRDLDMVKAESDKRMALLEEKLNSRNAAPPPPTDNGLKEVMATMVKMQDESNKRFERLLESQRQDKLDLILQSLNKQGAGGGLGTLKEQIQTVKTIKDLFDGGSGSDEEVDEEPKEWYEKLIDQVPKILDKLGEMSKGGKKVSKDEFMHELDAAAERATKEEIEKIKREQERPAAALPAPVAAAKEPERAQVGRPITPAHVQGLPGTAAGAAPVAAVVEPVAQPVATLPDAQAEVAAPKVDVPSIEKESLLMVTGVIVAISLEIEMRKNRYQWNYEGAWDNLPEDILERMCKAPDALTMLEALRVEGLHAEIVAKLDAVKAKVSGAPRAAVWINRGFKELQRWWEEREKDPEFDPADEDEELEEETKE